MLSGLLGFLTPSLGVALALLSALALFVTVFLAMCFRTVVSTNDVHIVQSKKKTTPYGRGMEAGNTYYSWPSWVPVWGVKIIKFPVSIFDISLVEYAAYDKGRLPFLVDILAFFQIEDPNIAAQRIHDFAELKEQLVGIVQGASRSILAKSNIEDILEERSVYGQRFTEAVAEDLKAWGVKNVKNIELMDIRDAKDSKVIGNIMAKKQSEIEMQSRTMVAENKKIATNAETEAQQSMDIRKQEAAEAVGKRTAEKDKTVGIANQLATQEIREQEKVTAEKTMEVKRVNDVKTADIHKQVMVVEAEQNREVTVIQAEAEKKTKIVKAEGEKEQTIIVATGNLEQAKMHATGIEAEGKARGIAETAILMAPIDTQIKLADKIDKSEAYQKYLLGVRNIEANEKIGVKQAESLGNAEIKIIANGGDITGGLSNARELFSSKGGTALAGMLESLSNSDVGKAALAALGVKDGNMKKGNGASTHE